MNPQFAKELTRIKQIVNPICLAHSKHTRLECPLPVWDSTGTMIGVGISLPLIMGGKPCEAKATFVVKLGEHDDKIAEKARAAIAAMTNELVVTIKPASRQGKTA